MQYELLRPVPVFPVQPCLGRFQLELFEPVLDLLSESDYVLVGGQAVSFWATYFVKHEPRLHDFLPFTSKDLDIYASVDAFYELLKKTGFEASSVFSVKLLNPRVLCVVIPFLLTSDYRILFPKT